MKMRLGSLVFRRLQQWGTQVSLSFSQKEAKERKNTWSLSRLSGMDLSGGTTWQRSSTLCCSYPGKLGLQSFSSRSLGKHTVSSPRCFSRFKWNFGLHAVFIFNPQTQSDLEAFPKYYGPELTQFFFTKRYPHIFDNAVLFYIWHSFQW